ncbi:MAG: cytochrome P460 family protein [Phycisphaeraceae bacterium]
MKSLTTRLTGLTLAALALTLVGCTYFGVPTGQDRVKADALEQEIEDYRTWDTPDWVAGYTESVHPLPAYVKYYVNAKGMSDIDNPPDGSVFVKEQFDEDKKFIGLTVMKKIDGYDPENGDWYWAIADTDAELTNAGRLNSSWTSNCIDCHKRGDGGGDLLFIND